MQFQFSFKQMSASDALRNYSQAKLSELIGKFVTKPIEAHVTFEVDRHIHLVRCHFSGGDGFNVQVEDQAEDMYAAVDRLMAKLEVQLRRQKEKIKSHKGNANIRDITTLVPPRTEGADAIDATDILKYEAHRRRMGNH